MTKKLTVEEKIANIEKRIASRMLTPLGERYCRTRLITLHRERRSYN